MKAIFGLVLASLVLFSNSRASEVSTDESSESESMMSEQPVEPMESQTSALRHEQSPIRIVRRKMNVLEAAVERNKVLSGTIRILFRAKPEEIFEHYSGLVDATASQIETSAKDNGAITVGDNGGDAYAAASLNFSLQDIEKLDRLLSGAVSEFVRKGGHVSWKDWVDLFEGDESLALRGVMVILDHHNMSNNHGNLGVSVSGSTVHDALGMNMGAFTAMTEPQNRKGAVLFGNEWGLEIRREYKIIAGMNLALYLREQGYSEKDIEFAVGRSSLVYESLDFLYDHLGREGKELGAITDKIKDFGLQDEVFYERVRLFLDSNPKVKAELLGSLFDMPDLTKLVSRSVEDFDLSDDLHLTLLLINFFVENEESFIEYFGPYLEDLPDGGEIYSLFRESRRDIRLVSHGAEFTVEHTPRCDREDREFKGILGTARMMNSVVDGVTRDVPRKLVRPTVASWERLGLPARNGDGLRTNEAGDSMMVSPNGCTVVIEKKELVLEGLAEKLKKMSSTHCDIPDSSVPITE